MSYVIAKVCLINKGKKLKKNCQPTDREVSIYEKSLLTLANMVGRDHVKGKLLVPKHFPGAPAEMEYTEIGTYSLEYHDYYWMNGNKKYDEFTFIKPFEYLLRLPQTKAVMIGHAGYPKLENQFGKKYYKQYEEPMLIEIEKFLARYGNMKEYIKYIEHRPASLSPIILRGILKDKFKFEGAVFVDALIMGAIQDVYKNILAREVFGSLGSIDNYSVSHGSNEQTLISILAIYAGIDILPLLSKCDKKYITKYAEKFPYFRICLEDATKRVLKIYPILDIPTPNIKNNSDRVNIILNETLFSRDIGWTDPWDRGGKLHQLFRRKYLALLYKEDKLFNDALTFCDLHQKIDWESLDPMFEQVINTKYLS